ncbi:NAD(P)H-dependent oxidoreductase, partial [Streptococcus agalactiae]|nr:NAD(P)H-dependent oxidoreductase [Streptococcus agalactiae]
MTKEDIKNQVRRAFDFRMEIRVYKNNDIPKEDKEYILDTACLSPSSVGLECWRFLVLDRQTIA